MSNNKILLMSATVLDVDSFCNSIGIDPKEVAYIKVPSTFPVKNREISLEFCNVNLKYTNLKEGLVDTVNHVEKILERHKNEKGIIHTANYNIAKTINDNILDSRLLVPNSYTRYEMLKRHLESNNPTVLVSPSMTEGVDLKDDYSRFQIICKIPYPFLGDKQISERKKVDPSWYAWKTCLAIVQSYGRSIRSEKDWAKTYILDESFKWFIKQNSNRLPSWFLKAVAW